MAQCSIAAKQQGGVGEVEKRGIHKIFRVNRRTDLQPVYVATVLSAFGLIDGAGKLYLHGAAHLALTG